MITSIVVVYILNGVGTNGGSAAHNALDNVIEGRVIDSVLIELGVIQPWLGVDHHFSVEESIE